MFVPWLPTYFTTVWWNGIPYYYANDTYYVWDEDRNEYEVVAPTDGFDQSATTRAPASNQLFVYPKNGQSAAQQANDRYECHRWAVGQTGSIPRCPAAAWPESSALAVGHHCQLGARLRLRILGRASQCAAARRNPPRRSLRGLLQEILNARACGGHADDSVARRLRDAAQRTSLG